MDSVAFSDRTTPGVFLYAAEINAAARTAGVPACALAAIVEVESGGRNVLQEGIAPGVDCGAGLCQVTYGVEWRGDHPYYKSQSLLNPVWNLTVAAKDFLLPAIDGCEVLRMTFPVLMQRLNGELLYFAFAVYNAGITEVTDALYKGVDPDLYTTDRYAARALGVYHRMITQSHKSPAAA